MRRQRRRRRRQQVAAKRQTAALSTCVINPHFSGSARARQQPKIYRNPILHLSVSRRDLDVAFNVMKPAPESDNYQCMYFDRGICLYASADASYRCFNRTARCQISFVHSDAREKDARLRYAVHRCVLQLLNEIDSKPSWTFE